jgi:glyoxylase-like metal-dependent hydrolase (beta-lactamase superfamily II)
MRLQIAWGVFVLILAASAPAAALELVKVADRVYALVGDLGQRSPENLGNNATHGFVITEMGIVLIDPGATAKGAQRIESAIRKVSDRPIVAIINTGGQDHRWLGNGHFKAKGATIIAAAAAVTDQRKRFDEQWMALRTLLGDAALEGTAAVYAEQAIEQASSISLGDTRIELIPSDGAHTPGDMIVWLPDERIAFAGDVVYADRLLAVLPVSHVGKWIAAFDKLVALNPEAIVPGHGRPTTLDIAHRETRAYLDHLHRTARAALDDGKDIETTLRADQSAFAHLVGFDQLAKRNLQQVYIEVEFE